MMIILTHIYIYIHIPYDKSNNNKIINNNLYIPYIRSNTNELIKLVINGKSLTAKRRGGKVFEPTNLFGQNLHMHIFSCSIVLTFYSCQYSLILVLVCYFIQLHYSYYFSMLYYQYLCLFRISVVQYVLSYLLYSYFMIAPPRTPIVLVYHFMCIYIYISHLYIILI